MKKNKLVTIAIVGYRNYKNINCTINSILIQSYENIELIISDDGSNSFPEEEIRNYIEQNKKTNIERVLLNHEIENRGTVKHINKVVSLATGEYLMLLAADDALNDSEVVKRFVQGFDNADEDCFIEIAQTAMYDKNLEKLEGYYLRPCIRKLIEGETKSKILNQILLYTACLPSTSFFYKMRFFEVFGPFDEDYMLIEDVPAHIRIAREGWKIHYENFVAIKHRSGGISHGATDALSKTKLLYQTDCLTMLIEQEKICNADFDTSDKAIKTILRRNKFERNQIKKVIKTRRTTLRNALGNGMYWHSYKNWAHCLIMANIAAILYVPQVSSFFNTILQPQNPIEMIIYIILSTTLAIELIWLSYLHIKKMVWSLNSLP